MGLSTKPEDGRSQGWLAAFMCCWTAKDNAGSPDESQRAWPANEICREQPAPLRAMPAFPTHAVLSRRSSGFSSRHTKQASEVALIPAIPERPPSLSPLDFGDSSFFTKPPQSRQRDSTQTQPIGTPVDLRRAESADGHRNSLIPLKLSPVVLRAASGAEPSRSSPVQTETASRSTDTLAGSSDQLSRYRRSSLLRSHPSSSSITSVPPTQSCASDDTRASPLVREFRSPRQPLSTQSSTSSMRSLRLRATDPAGTFNPSMSSFDRHWLKRKRSNQSVTKSVYEIDREILELNTIVEERRIEAARSVSPSEHVPAIAPSMPVRARSKTLTDIGSAFSKPATSVSATSARLSRPFMPDLFGPEVVDPIVRPSTAHATTGTRARVSGWFSDLLRSSSATRNSVPEPFYKCTSASHQPPVSTSSLCTLVTDLESPCPTMASSPASKEHGRTLTLELRGMPVSTPPMMKENARRNGKQDGVSDWPLVTDDVGQVGIAL